MGDNIIISGGTRIIGNSLTLTGVVQSLPNSSLPLITVWIQNKASNSNPVYLVDSLEGNVVLEIAVGATLTLDVYSISVIRLLGTNGESIYWGAIVE